jgi:hypothetical protein
MHTLFAISVLSLFVLLMAGVAIARHIRIGRSVSSPQREREFADHLFAAAKGRSVSETVVRRARSVPAQTIKEIMAGKSWNQPPEIVTLRPDPEAHKAYDQTLSEPVQGQRKSPQPAHRRDGERLDWGYFNKDLGDLTDPYQTPRLRANSRDRATSPKRL